MTGAPARRTLRAVCSCRCWQASSASLAALQAAALAHTQAAAGGGHAVRVREQVVSR